MENNHTTRPARNNGTLHRIHSIVQPRHARAQLRNLGTHSQRSTSRLSNTQRSKIHLRLQHRRMPRHIRLPKQRIRPRTHVPSRRHEMEPTGNGRLPHNDQHSPTDTQTKRRAMEDTRIQLPQMGPPRLSTHNNKRPHTHRPPQPAHRHHRRNSTRTILQSSTRPIRQPASRHSIHNEQLRHHRRRTTNRHNNRRSRNHNRIRLLRGTPRRNRKPGRITIQLPTMATTQNTIPATPPPRRRR